MSDHTRLQEIHGELTKLRKRRKELAASFKDELTQHDRYEALLEELAKCKAEKQTIEGTVREGSPKDAQELEELKVEIKAQEELLSDLAMNLIMAEETIELVDENLNRYTPVLVVRFKKDGYADAKEDEAQAA